jgi:hypothetical protein
MGRKKGFAGRTLKTELWTAVRLGRLIREEFAVGLDP